MKKTPKQIAAIITLIVIAILIIAFFVSAFTAGTNSNIFYALLASIIALPIIAWMFILIYGRVKGKHSMAEILPESMLPTEEEVEKARAMQEKEKANSSEE